MYLPLPSADPTLPPSSFRPSDPNLPPFLLQTPPPPTPGTRYHSMHKGTNPFQPKSAIWHRMPLHAQYLFIFFLNFYIKLKGH